MKVFLPLLLLLAASGFAQVPIVSEPCPPNSQWFVYSTSGLNIREQPDSIAKVLALLPYGEEVTVTADASQAKAFIAENISDHWTRINWKSKTGYVFDGFLSRLHPVDPKNTVPDEVLLKNSVLQSIDTVKPTQNYNYYSKSIYSNGVILKSSLENENVSLNNMMVPAKPCSFKEIVRLYKVTKPEFMTITFIDNNNVSLQGDMRTITLRNTGEYITMMTAIDP